MIHKFRMVFMTKKRFRIKNTTKLIIHDHTTISATSSSAV